MSDSSMQRLGVGDSGLKGVERKANPWGTREFAGERRLFTSQKNFLEESE
jgi:hypothetical protein